MKKTFIVAAYDCGQEYGGPEEGGWWYDAGSLVRVLKLFRNEELAFDYCSRLNRRLRSKKFGPNQGKHDYTSVLSEGLILAYVFEDIAPAGFPDHRPHYE